MKFTNTTKIITVIFIIYICILIGINYSTPLGLHVSIAIAKKAEPAKTIEARFYDLFLWRELSSKIVKISKNKCDLPRSEYYDINTKKISLTKAIFFKENVQGENERIVFLVSNRRNDDFDSELILGHILDSIKICDINHALPNDYPPFIIAIFLADIEIINLFTSKNVDFKKKIQRPEKPTNDLNSLEFAQLLQNKTKSEDKKIAYQEIIEIIQEKIKERNAATFITP